MVRGVRKIRQAASSGPFFSSYAPERGGNAGGYNVSRISSQREHRCGKKEAEESF
jgi:hypothetical protein